MQQKLTGRGFKYYEFDDDYGGHCSLQESSAARIEMDDGTVTDGYIWLGMDKDSAGREVHTHLDKVTGHKVGGRMHLSQSQVRELIPILRFFAKHGELPQITSDHLQELKELSDPEPNEYACALCGELITDETSKHHMLHVHRHEVK